jgi:tripartite-type tricarboxylate transporter receptor subunit TctC
VIAQLLWKDIMKLPRRQFLRLVACTSALPFASRVTTAQTYPTRPVRVIVPFAPAGTTDILARLIGQWLSERLGQSFIIENRPGASTMIGTEAVVRSPADGYTLLVFGTGSAINETLYENKISYDFLRDIAPVAGILRVPNVVVVHPSLPVRTIPELIAYAKANPGRINVESPGAGTSSHLAGELFMVMTGVDMVHVQYRGNAPALIDLLAGQVQLGFDTLPASIEYIRTGKLRALAVSTHARSQALPDLPSVSEFVPGYESSGFFGVGAPGKTTSEIVDKLNKEINAGLADPKLKARLADLGGMVLSGSPADFRTLIAEEIKKWGKVIRAANIKAE